MKMSRQEVSGPGTATSAWSGQRLVSALDTARQRICWRNERRGPLDG
jgi:hypothetical protein